MKPLPLDTGVYILGPSASNIISDEALIAAFEYANFGENPPYRELILEGLIQASFGYSQGSSMTGILVNLKLCKPRSGRTLDLKPTKFGLRYLRAENKRSMSELTKYMVEEIPCCP